MCTRNTNGAVLAGTTPSGTDFLLGGRTSPEDTLPLHALQVGHLVARFGLSEPHATTVADLVFGRWA